MTESMSDRRWELGGLPAFASPQVARVRRPAVWRLSQRAAEGLDIHLVLRGTSRLHAPGGPPRRVDPGDILLLRGVTDDDLEHVVPLGLETIVARYRLGGPGATEWASALPSVVHLRSASTGGDPSVCSLTTLIRDEFAAGTSAGQALVKRLFDALIVAAARHALPRGSALVQGKIADTRVARTLVALHNRFSDRWTLAKMAKLAGMSRAAFAIRFRKETGFAPLAYLTRLRMDVARALLVETDEPAGLIAPRVGYRSVYAFSRAFKRMTGQPPVVYRRAERTLPPIVCRATALRLVA